MEVQGIQSYNLRTDDYWNVYWDVTREVKLRFDAEGISIPFPQRDVHIYGTGTRATPPILSEKAYPNPAPSETHGPDVGEDEN